MNSTNKIYLKPLSAVLLGCIASIFAGGTAFGVSVVTKGVLENPAVPNILRGSISTFMSSLCVGILVCAFAELTFFIPFLLLYRKVTWPWPDYRSGAFVGFISAAIPTFIIFLLPIEGKLSEALGNFANGLPTTKGIVLAASNALALGFVGAVCGLVFWAIAVRGQS